MDRQYSLVCCLAPVFELPYPPWDVEEAFGSMISLAFTLSQETDCLGEISLLQRTQADCSGLARGPLGSTWHCMCPKNTLGYKVHIKKFIQWIEPILGKIFHLLDIHHHVVFKRQQMINEKKNLSVLQWRLGEEITVGLYKRIQVTD